MKITKTQLRQIIKEELGKVLNEEESNKLDFLYDTDGVPGLLAHHKHFTANIDMQFKEYTQNLNNNLVKAVESGNIQDIKKYGHLALKDLNYQMPRSQHRQTQSALEQLDNTSNATDQSEFGSKKQIDAEEIEDHQMPRGRKVSFSDEESDLQLIQKVAPSMEVSDPHMANWDESKDQIVYQGSVASNYGGKKIYFKTSNSNQYYVLSAE